MYISNPGRCFSRSGSGIVVLLCADHNNSFKQVLELLHDDVLAFEHFESDHVENASGLAHKTTVGLMEKDCIVTNVLIGSPAEELLKVRGETDMDAKREW